MPSFPMSCHRNALTFVASAMALILISTPAVGAESDAILEKLIPRLVETYRHLHANPELSFQEKETAAFLAGRLKSLGYQVTEGVGRYRDPKRTSYGLVGVLTNGEGPTVMLRTDLDGLPVEEKTGLPYASQARALTEEGREVAVMHACGHDLHMASFLGAAELLAALRDRWRGTLVVIGQPAEEHGEGARAMLEDGLYTRFPQPDYVVALHTDALRPAGQVGLCPGYALANVDSVDITVRGVGGHGAYPHTTRDPVVLASQIVLALQTIVSRQTSPFDPAVVTVGSIRGGTRRNIIPDDVRLELTVRSYRPEVRQSILDSIRRIVYHTALAAGLPEERLPLVEISEDEYTPAVYNDPEFSERIRLVLNETLGEDRVAEADPVMGGEDFSRFALPDRRIPTHIFWLGAVDPAVYARFQEEGRSLPSLHSSEMAPAPEPALRTGVQALTAILLDLLSAEQ